MNRNKRAEQALNAMVKAEAAHAHHKLLEGEEGYEDGYAGPEGLIVIHGRMFDWKPLSRRFSMATKWGAPRVCFANSAIACATSGDLRYAEGFAYCGQFAVHHAWCVDALDNVIDFTWREDIYPPRNGRAYLGVLCPLRAAFDACWNDMGYLESVLLEGGFPDPDWDPWHGCQVTDEDRRYVMSRSTSLLKGARNAV